MGEAKDLIYSLVIMLGLMGLAGYFITSTLVSYNEELPAQYNSTLKILSNTSGLSTEIETQRDYLNKLNKTTSSYSLFDIGGFYFQEALKPLKLMFNSLNIFGKLVDSSVDSLADTEFSRSLNIIFFILRMLVILGVIFLFLAVLLKWEL